MPTSSLPPRGGLPEPGWYQDPTNKARLRRWDGSAWLPAERGWEPDPENPGRSRYWTGLEWRPPVPGRVLKAFGMMTAAGVTLVAWGNALVPDTGASCSRDLGSTEEWRACRRVACDQLADAARSPSAWSWLVWLLLLALAITATWIGYHQVRGHASRARVLLIAALVAAWTAAITLFPGVLAMLGAIGGCTT